MFKEEGVRRDGQVLGLYLNDDQSYWSRSRKKDQFTDRVRQSTTDTNESIPISMYLNEIRQLYYGAAYLELCGRLIYLSAAPEGTSELIERLTQHYLGSGKDALLSICVQGTPSELITKLHTALKSAGQTVSPDEPVAYRLIHGALCELEDLLG